MKLIELNIGLHSKTLGKLNYVEILNSLTGRGFEVIKYRIVESTCKDGKELCLAVKSTPPRDWQAQLASLSDNLGQDCISVAGFIGRDPYDTFIPSLWKSSHRFVIQYSLDGIIWHDKTLPSKLTPLYYDDERAAEGEISRCVAVALRSYDAVQYIYRVTPEKNEPEQEIDGFTRKEFLDYLEFSIILDSKLAGSKEYTQIFETALKFLQNK